MRFRSLILLVALIFASVEPCIAALVHPTTALGTQVTSEVTLANASWSMRVSDAGDAIRGAESQARAESLFCTLRGHWRGEAPRRGSLLERRDLGDAPATFMRNAHCASSPSDGDDPS